jgi:hypothetical protein
LELQTTHSRGLLHPGRPKASPPGTPVLCHTGIDWDVLG